MTQPYGPPQFPGPYQPVQPPRRHGLRNGCLIAAAVLGGGLILVVILVVIGAALGRSGSTAATGQPGTAATGTGPAASGLPGIGDVVKDGDFAFVVRKITCGAGAAAAVGAGGFGEKIPGGARECIITLKVTNDKGQAQTFFDSNQYAYDASGRQFSADTTGSIYLHGDQDLTQVNPGITIIAPVPFQIPAGDRIVRMVLHDSAFSGGVSVRV